MWPWFMPSLLWIVACTPERLYVRQGDGSKQRARVPASACATQFVGAEWVVAGLPGKAKDRDPVWVQGCV
eukprot:9621552-Lingulodinium_polyedra.AAC.1